MTTKTEKQQDLNMAIGILTSHKEDLTERGALVLISQEIGKGQTDFYRVTIAFKRGDKIQQNHLTWAIAKALGFSLRDRKGYWWLAVNGGGYSKPYEIAQTLAHFYNIERINHEVI